MMFTFKKKGMTLSLFPFIDSNGWSQSFWTKCLVIFQSSESVPCECKTIGYDRNFILFPNMSSEILCLFLFASNEGVFERLKKLLWTQFLSQSFWRIFDSSLAHLKIFQMRGKLWVMVRILCSFQIWVQKCCICLCTRVISERSFEHPEKLVFATSEQEFSTPNFYLRRC